MRLFSSKQVSLYLCFSFSKWPHLEGRWNKGIWRNSWKASQRFTFYLLLLSCVLWGWEGNSFREDKWIRDNPLNCSLLPCFYHSSSMRNQSFVAIFPHSFDFIVVCPIRKWQILLLFFPWIGKSRCNPDVCGWSLLNWWFFVQLLFSWQSSVWVLGFCLVAEVKNYQEG